MQRLRTAALKTTVAGITIVGTVEIATNIPSQGRSSDAYRHLSDEIVTPLLRRCLSAETAHNLALEAVKRGFAPTYAFPTTFAEHSTTLSSAPFGRSESGASELVFSNPVGLAAGFDKDGVAVRGLMDMGFGFVEIGSVTPLPQPGNAKPRLFRLVEDEGVVNRFGFNSAGMEEVGGNLKKFRILEEEDNIFEVISVEDDWSEKLRGLWNIAMREGKKKIGVKENSVKPKCLLGINLGKNKVSEDEIGDYQKGISHLGPYADYIVINISSPNTPNLRDTFQNSDKLRDLLSASISERNSLPNAPLLLVKLSPDLTNQQLMDVATTVMLKECRVDGIVVSNTTETRPEHLRSKNKDEIGGLSGKPLRQISTDTIRKLYAFTNGSLPIIGVGGVSSGRDAFEKLKAGASLVQLYSGLVYQGPGVVARIRRELSEIMQLNGLRRLEDVVGLDHEDIYWRKRKERSRKTNQGEETIFEE